MTYNLQKDNDETLGEFIQILGRIKELAGEAAVADDKGIDLAAAIEYLRESGGNKVADELAELVKRADELQAQQQLKS